MTVLPDDACTLVLAMDRAATTPESTSSEERFLDYAQHDNAHALESVLRDHLDQAYTLARRILGNYADAEDAVQEALARLVATAPSYTGAIPFGAWLGQLVQRSAVEVRRARRRRVTRERVALTDAGQQDEQPAESEEIDILRRAIQGLPERYREPIELHYFGGLSQEETGRVLGLKEAAVAQRLHRARERIRVRLKGQGVASAMLPFLLGQLRAQVESAPAQLVAHAAASSRLLVVAGTASSMPWWGVGLTTALISVVAGVVLSHGAHSAASATASVRGAAMVDGAAMRPSPTPASSALSALSSSSAPLPRVVPAAPPGHLAAAALNWDFNQPGTSAGLTLLKGSWHQEPSGGVNDSGCMKIDSTDVSLAIDLSHLRLPVVLTCQTLVDGISYTTAQWQDRDEVQTAQFTGLGHYEIGIRGWMPVRIYIDEHSIDHWEGGHRYGLLAIRRLGQSPLKLVGRSMQGLDDLRISEIPQAEVPDVRTFLEVFDRIPVSQRHGTLTLPAATLEADPSAGAVGISFPDSLPISNP